MRELRPLPGDSTSAATAINDQGQVAGISGECDIAVGKLSARHSVRWEKDTVINIGDLGGDAWHTPMDINAAGDVVGFSNPRGVVGIDFNPHAFLWTKGNGIRDLGTLPGRAAPVVSPTIVPRWMIGVTAVPELYLRGAGGRTPAARDSRWR